MMKIPKHVAIILDGNGRWAKSKGMPRNYGHTVGAKNVETVCQAADELGIEYLTQNGHPLSDGLWIFHGKLESSGQRSGCTDETAGELFEKLYPHGK